MDINEIKTNIDQYLSEYEIFKIRSFKNTHIHLHYLTFRLNILTKTRSRFIELALFLKFFNSLDFY